MFKFGTMDTAVGTLGQGSVNRKPYLLVSSRKCFRNTILLMRMDSSDSHLYPQKRKTKLRSVTIAHMTIEYSRTLAHNASQLRWACYGALPMGLYNFCATISKLRPIQRHYELVSIEIYSLTESCSMLTTVCSGVRTCYARTLKTIKTMLRDTTLFLFSRKTCSKILSVCNTLRYTARCSGYSDTDKHINCKHLAVNNF